MRRLHEMSRIGERERHARRVRKVKLKKLRAKLLNAKTGGDKERVLVKVMRIAPWMTEAEFVATTKREKKA